MGFSWVVYLFYVPVFLIVYFIAIQLAITPIYAPQNFQFAEEIINRHGWIGMKEYFTIDDLPWATTHLMGIIFRLFSEISG